MESNKLPEDFKVKWIAALRSGRYEQCTSGTLISTKEGRKTHCCIAVAAEESGEKIDDNVTYNWLANMIGMDEVGVLWLKNDGDGDDIKSHSFSEIADYIETNL